MDHSVQEVQKLGQCAVRFSSALLWVRSFIFQEDFFSFLPALLSLPFVCSYVDFAPHNISSVLSRRSQRPHDLTITPFPSPAPPLWFRQHPPPIYSLPQFKREREEKTFRNTAAMLLHWLLHYFQIIICG